MLVRLHDIPRQLRAPVNFELTDEQAELRDAARRLAQERFKDKAARWDRDEEFPEENKHLLAELGYLGLSIDREHGGAARGWSAPIWWWRKSPRSTCSPP